MQDFRKHLKRYQLTVISLSFISLILLTVVIVNFSTRDNANFCFTTKCLQTSITIQQKLQELNCDKNYVSSCEVPYNNRLKNMELMQSLINSVIVDFVNKPIKITDTAATKLVKNFYAACANQEIQDEVALETIFKYLQQVGLPKIPSFLLDIDNHAFDFMKISANAKKLLGIDLFFGLKLLKGHIVLLTTNTPFDNEPYYPSLFGNDFMEGRQNHTARDIFKSATNEILKTVLSSENVTVDNIIINKASDVIWNLMMYYEQYDANENNSSLNFKILNKNKYLGRYLNLLLKDIDNFEQIDVHYYEREFEFVTNLTSLRKSVLELFSWFKIVSTLVSNTGKLENNKFGNFRIKNCYNLTAEFLDISILSNIIDGHFLHKTKAKISDMIRNIRTIFRSQIYNKSLHPFWREKYFRLLDNLKYKIAAPYWILNQTKVMDYYKNVRITQRTYIDNMVSIMQSETLRKLKFMFNGTTSIEDWQKISEVVLEYESNTNTIKIPFALLRPPIFDLGLSSLEYGSLGTTIARELWIYFRNLGYVDQDDIIKQLALENKVFASKHSSGQELENHISIYIAFQAYQIFSGKHKPEEILPGFQDFTNDDMFYLGTLFNLE